VGLAPPVCVVLSGGSPAVWRGGIGNHGQVQVCCKFWFLISGAGLRQFYRYFYASFIGAFVVLLILELKKYSTKKHQGD
jgi:hypothetical protein